MKDREQIFKGISLAPGYGEGKAFLYSGNTVLPRPACPIRAEDVDAEVALFERALSQSLAELERIREGLECRTGAETAAIFMAHQVLLQDPAFVDACKARISQDRIIAAKAVQMSIEELEAKLLSLDSEHLRERVCDVRDIGQRLWKHLAIESGAGLPSLAQIPKGSVVVAREFMPSDTVEFDCEDVAGIVTELGGPSAHTAILARSLGIPAVTRISGLLDQVSTGDWLMVDGEEGIVRIGTEQASVKRFRKDMDRYRTVSNLAVQAEHQRCIMKCGTEIQLHANISRIRDAQGIHNHNLAGAGLVRTEFLFMNTALPPSVDDHLSAYLEIAGLAGGRPLVLRTLDLGGDKRPSFLASRIEDNPAIGLRGLRFSLAERTIFETQLRGILRASESGDIRIMFPMVLGAADIQEAMDLTAHLSREEGIAIPPIGAMIETPAAIFELDEILKVADFVSIGTNDLTQFILTADRESPQMLDYFTILHPAVLKAVRQVLSMANEAGKPASICGEAAGDPATACLFVGMGCHDLSMSPIRAARVRRLLVNSELARLQAMCKLILAAPSVTTVQKILSETTSSIAAEVSMPETKYEYQTRRSHRNGLVRDEQSLAADGEDAAAEG